MDTVTILRDLWRARVFVAVVALVAIMAGILVGFRVSLPTTIESRRYEVGVASARILVDTPNSQVVEVAPKGSDTLGVRANLLASLMVDGVIKEAVAQRAGLKPDQLVGLTDAASEPTPDAPPSERSAFILKTLVLTNSGGDQLPIIEINAQAPDVRGAARLASAAVSGLRDYLNSKAATQRIPDADRLQVNSLGAPQAAIEARGPSKVLASMAAIFLFVLGCGAILMVRALVRGLRAAAQREQLEEQGVFAAPQPAFDPAERFADDVVDHRPVALPRPALVSPPQPRHEPPPARAAAPDVPPPPRPRRSAGQRRSQSAWDAPLRAAGEE
jgi:hypothetical protein